MKFSWFCLVFFVASCELSKAKPLDADDDLVVTLVKPQSKVRGHILKSFIGIDYYAFQDIPYAVPPVGNFRFREPSPHPGWEGILNATENKKVCVQDGAGQEDCLVLNVFTPVKAGGEKLPVFFWIHGGAFKSGSCNMQNCGPQYFIDYGVIIVTIHYRVGPFGFLTTEDGVIPGNIGIKDQLLALKWVNKNIEAFGGDPTKITIGGQSAGSISISAHFLSEKSKGLYRAAVMQSGSALVHGSYINTARNYSFQLGKLLDPTFNSTNSTDLLRLLALANATDIQRASNKIQPISNQVGLLPDVFWGLVVENKSDKNPYLTVPFHQALMEGKFNKVPILTGFATEEVLFFVSSLKQLTDMAAIYDKNPSDLVTDKLNVAKSDVPILGEGLIKLYSNTTLFEDPLGFLEFTSDVGLTNPVIRQAALAAKYVDTYLYHFSYEGVGHIFNKLNASGVDGTTHSEDLVYMWGRKVLASEDDLQVSKNMIDMWTNFIKTLNPTPTDNDTVIGNFKWPKITDLDNLEYININNTLSVNQGPKKYKAFRDLLAKYIKPPYNIY